MLCPYEESYPPPHRYKQLLETLAQWARGEHRPHVSDVYVRLGYEFNMSCREFTAIKSTRQILAICPKS